ncbi:SDR family NAD(P)-dependent oxidoreductase [Symbioplanes lichenis]|uniref:SDR family NAD(P)-dependent oxidoreductase n=1 Tax=Symbioplanes lichenis TaxID=1629072 RepID=UPI00273A0BA0|nr:SDR family NAD(P)-dependent oxidoreductase [Actinoplanes lichenis]
MEPYRFAGRTAVVTGAASGIGARLAHGLARRGSDLVLLDRDAARLDEVAAAVREEHPGRTVEVLVADLAERDEVLAAAARVRERHSNIGLLVNNAGVALGGRFDQVSLEQFEHVMAVNFTAPLLLTHHLLGALSPGGHLVNVSSLFGLVAPPGQSAYAASKFALRGLSESLRWELLENGIGVTTVHPGGVRTRIALSAQVGAGVPAGDIERHRKLFAALLSYPADKAAEDILRAVRRRQARLLIATSAKVPDAFARLFPASHMGLVARLTRARTK